MCKCVSSLHDPPHMTLLLQPPETCSSQAILPTPLPPTPHPLPPGHKHLPQPMHPQQVATTAGLLPSMPSRTGHQVRINSLYRLTINIPVPSVFRHEFQSAVSNCLGWRITVFGRHCLCLCIDGAVPRIRCLLMLDY